MRGLWELGFSFSWQDRVIMILRCPPRERRPEGDGFASRAGGRQQLPEKVISIDTIVDRFISEGKTSAAQEARLMLSAAEKSRERSSGFFEDVIGKRRLQSEGEGVGETPCVLSTSSP